MIEAYSENSGWDEILTAIKERLSQPMAGNFMKNESIREYYRSTPRESSIKSVRRIVSQNLQKAKQLTVTTSTSETAMSQTIVDNRSAKKCSPEERKSAKFSQTACLDEDSSDTDADPDLPGEANPTPPEPKQDKPKKKRSRKRQRPWEKAHKAHTEMCGKAVKMMSKIERILDKFDSDSSDED